MANDYLYTLATDVLNSVVDRFTNEGIDLPERQYVTGGQVAIDCEQLVVEVMRVFTGLPGAEVVRPVDCAVPRSAEIRIWLIRCVPVVKDSGDAPSAGELDTSGKKLLTDGWVLTWGLLAEYRDGNFLSQCDKLAIGNLLSVGPDGAYGGWNLRIQADLTSWTNP